MKKDSKMDIVEHFIVPPIDTEKMAKMESERKIKEEKESKTIKGRVQKLLERQSTLDFAIKELAEKGPNASHIEDNLFTGLASKKFSTHSVRDYSNCNRKK